MMASEDALKRCSELIECYLDCLKRLQDFRAYIYRPRSDRQPSLSAETVRILLQYQSDRSLGAYCLIVNKLVWDAEIVTRSVYETFSKIMFIASAQPEQRKLLAEEYWLVLGAIYDRKGADKASTASRLARRFDVAGDRILSALTSSKFFSTDPILNKRLRNEIEQRWSFSEIVKTLSKSEGSREPINGLDALGHMYGMMSHLSHASSKALDLMEDRATRGADLVLLESTHINRILSDLVSLYAFSLRYAHITEYGDIPHSDPLADIVSRMESAGQDIRAEFHSSQNDLYKNFD